MNRIKRLCVVRSKSFLAAFQRAHLHLLDFTKLAFVRVEQTQHICIASKTTSDLFLSLLPSPSSSSLRIPLHSSTVTHREHACP
jgi:hypothetical protein